MLGIKKPKVDKIVGDVSRRFGVKIVKYANVGNHLHLVVKLPGGAMTARRQYAKWIRLLTSRLAFEIGGARKGQPLLDERGERTKFWDSIPFSRVVHGRRGWKVIDRYVLKNQFESAGVPTALAVTLAGEFHESARVLDLPEWPRELRSSA